MFNKYYQTHYSQGNQKKWFIAWNWGAFFLGPFWLFYRGLFLQGALFFSILLSKIIISHYFEVNLFFSEFAMHLLLGCFGTTLYFSKYDSNYHEKEIPKQKDYFVLNFSDEHQINNPSINDLEKSLLNLDPKKNNFLVVNFKNDFIQTYAKESEQSSKLYCVEYKNGQKNILFSANELKTYDETLELFKIFLDHGSILRETNWTDTEIDTDTGIQSPSANTKTPTYPIGAFVMYFILSNSILFAQHSLTDSPLQLNILPFLNFNIQIKENHRLNINDDNTLLNVDEDSIKKSISQLKVDEFIILDGKEGFIQACLVKKQNDINLFGIEYRLKNNSIQFKSNELIEEKEIINLFTKFYLHDESYKTDIDWTLQDIHH